MSSRMSLLRKLDDCLRWADENEHLAEEIFNVAAFEKMRRQAQKATYEFSLKQQGWVDGVHARIFDQPNYENAFSAGRVVRGKEVPTPAVLLNLPKKPPSRRTGP